jgi:hypothetical protein
MRTLVLLAGAGQIGLVAASLLIPRLLHWKEELAKLRPLTRHVVTTYAFYIAGTNLAFGLLSALRPEWLLDGSGLARSVAGFIALYWGVRLVLQFAYYDRKDAPSGLGFRVAEAALVTLFLALAWVYGLIAWRTPLA